MLICFSATTKDQPSSEYSSSDDEHSTFIPDTDRPEGSRSRNKEPASTNVARSPSLASQYSSIHYKLTKELTTEDKWTVYERRHQVMWQPDSTAPRDCPLCERWFFWLWRRLHHCRKWYVRNNIRNLRETVCTYRSLRKVVCECKSN